MKIRWLGHAMFKMEIEGFRIITDPYDAKVGYPLPDVEADIVTVSHEHYDHNNISFVRGNYQVVNKDGSECFNGLVISGIKTYHDDVQGKQRGENIILSIEGEEMKVVHMGDYGESYLRKEVKDFLQDVDILCIPVGGVYTIDPLRAASIVKDIKPKVAIPMHYQTRHLSFSLSSVDNFTRLQPFEVKNLSGEFEIKDQDLPSETCIYILDYL